MWAMSLGILEWFSTEVDGIYGELHSLIDSIWLWEEPRAHLIQQRGRVVREQTLRPAATHDSGVSAPPLSLRRGSPALASGYRHHHGCRPAPLATCRPPSAWPSTRPNDNLTLCPPPRAAAARGQTACLSSGPSNPRACARNCPRKPHSQLHDKSKHAQETSETALSALGPVQ